jgi:hypothetical protein
MTHYGVDPESTGIRHKSNQEASGTTSLLSTELSVARAFLPGTSQARYSSMCLSRMGNGVRSGAFITFCLQGCVYLKASFLPLHAVLANILLEHLCLLLDPMLRLATVARIL